MKYCITPVVILAVFASTADVEARKWTSHDGRYSTEAELVGLKEEEVRLRKTNGQLITVPLERLSEADQRYVKADAARSDTDTQQPAGGGSSVEVAGRSSSQTCTLRLKRLEPLNLSRVTGRRPPADYLYRRTRPQFFSMRTGSGRPDSRARAFPQIVNKEPDKYESEHPFRGVANLGSGQYGFVLDLTAPKPDPTPPKSGPPAPSSTVSGIRAPNSASQASKQEGHGRLYFDLNHNGDLTDDKVIETTRWQGDPLGRFSRYEFPRVDLTIEVDGTKVDYAFFFSVNSQKLKDFAYASASLNAAAYREGQITLDGKRQQIVLLDFNSNGRFDDELKIRESSGRAYPVYGDTLLVSPDPSSRSLLIGYDLAANQVSKLVNIDGRFYDLEISVAGDQLTLTPSTVPIGYVTNANEGFRGVLYSDQGTLGISECNSKPAPLPEGKWKLASYTISHTGQQERTGRAGDKEERSLPRPSRYSVVSAWATAESKAIRVRKGETVALPFGPPYKAIVKAASPVRGGQQVRLGMSLVGSGSEVCSSLYVGGKRPEEPTFTISTPEGEEVVTGKFEWG